MSRVALVVCALFLQPTGVSAPQSGEQPKRLRSRPEPPLSQLRFSPDGRFVLAQDDSAVTVLTVQPFAVVFQLPAHDATPAMFTPDSRDIVFVSSAASLRLPTTGTAHFERWSVGTRARAALLEFPVHGCGTHELSPDGGTLACVDRGGTLWLLDVRSGEVVFQKPHFAKPFLTGNPGDPPQPFGDLGEAWLDFSPDGRFVIALPKGARGSAVAYDISGKGEVKLQGALGRLATTYSQETELVSARSYSTSFAFISPKRVVSSPHFDEVWHPTVAGTLAGFPSGNVLSTVKLPPGPLFRATDSRFVLIRPFGQYPRVNGEPRAAAVEISTGQVIVSEAPALDVFGSRYVAELTDGGVGLYERGKGLQATIKRQEIRAGSQR